MKLSYCILCQNNYQFSLARSLFPGKKVLKITNPLLLNGGQTVAGHQPREYIAWLGIFQYQKNIPLLFEIASLLKTERFLIAGREHRNCDEDTKYFLRKLSELPNVQFVGFLERDKIPLFFRGAKFLLNTSHYEGFSNTFLEAMSVGTPIITSSRVNPDEIISRHSLGIVFKDLDDLQQQYEQMRQADYEALVKNIAYYIGEHDYRLLSRRLLEMLSENTCES